MNQFSLSYINIHAIVNMHVCGYFIASIPHPDLFVEELTHDIFSSASKGKF